MEVSRLNLLCYNNSKDQRAGFCLYHHGTYLFLLTEATEAYMSLQERSFWSPESLNSFADQGFTPWEKSANTFAINGPSVKIWQIIYLFL